jgi:hypothetical protein
MGRRFSGCGGGQLPAGFGQMMGAVNAMGIMGGGMMGGANQGGRSYGGPASTMGGYSSSANTNDEDFEQRFARGELTENEYRDRKRLLEGG